MYLDPHVSTRSVLFTAWATAALQGCGVYDWVTSDGHHEESGGRKPNRAERLAHFRQLTKRLALTERQMARIDAAISRLQPVIVQLQSELRAKHQLLFDLRPGRDTFNYDTGRISNEIGTLATQLALTASKLRADVYTILDATQQSLLDELLIGV